MDKIAIFPGSFDPFTAGHLSIVNRALPLFDKIIVSIGFNANKKSFFPFDTRKQWLVDIFANEPKIEIVQYKGLTVEHCKKMNANYILRGLRTSADFEFERAIAQTNKLLCSSIETIFLLTTPELSPISSTIVKDIIGHGGDVSKFVPKEIADSLEELKTKS